MNVFLGVINNICSHEHPENTTLGTSTLELQNTTINVIWSQADFTELYLVLQKGKYEHIEFQVVKDISKCMLHVYDYTSKVTISATFDIF